MPILYLARHGAHGDVGARLTGRGGGGLTEEGRAQAERLAARLGDRGIRAIHASPQTRTRETAAVVAERIGVAVEVAPALDEVDFGEWTGRSFAELDGDPAWTHWNSARGSARVPGGESMGEAVDRAQAHVDAVVSDAGPVLCVTHCDIVRGLVARWLGLDLDNLLRFDVDPGSLTAVAIEHGGGRVMTLNEGGR
jgi:broad specificity phosphatase PhoE